MCIPNTPPWQSRGKRNDLAKDLVYPRGWTTIHLQILQTKVKGEFPQKQATLESK